MMKFVVVFVIMLVVGVGAVIAVSSFFRAQEDSQDYYSKSIYVYNLTDQKEVMNINANVRRAPASLVKMMTVYVALQKIPDLSQTAPVDPESYLALIDRDASMAGFVGNEQTNYRDLLYGTMLASGGEAAASLAINISSTEKSFVKQMNIQAKAFNLKRTRFQNVTGLDARGQSTTAKDMAMLLRQCLHDENFHAVFTRRAYTSTATADHPGGLHIESNVMKSIAHYAHNGFTILGGKSGTTLEAGLCLAVLAEKEDKSYIVVVMGAPYDPLTLAGDGHIQDTLNILAAL